MDTGGNEMECFDFNKQFSVTIISEDDESDFKDEVKSHFFTNDTAESKQKKCTNEEQRRVSVLRISKDKIHCKNSDDSIKANGIYKKKKKSNKTKKYSKETKEEKKVYKSKDKDLEPIDMEPELHSLPSDTADGRNTVDVNKDEIKTSEDIKNSLKNNDKKDESHQYINDLLSKVSESIIHIFDAYCNHVSIAQQCSYSDSRLLESKKRFTRIKQHFFQLSYCTTNIIILSRENDNLFTEEFLNNTVKLAEQNNNRKLSVYQIQPIYYELINWVKQKKELQNLPVTPVYPSCNLPTLRKQLSQSTVSSPVSSIPSNVVPKVSIFNSSPQNREIRISLEENKGGMVSSNSMAHTSYQNKMFQPAFQQKVDQYPNFDSLKYLNHQMNKYFSDMGHSQRPNVFQATSPTPNISRDNVGNVNKCMVPSCVCQNQNQVDMTHNVNMRQQPNLPSYEQSFAWKNESFNIATNNVDNTRSVSTDSGFISPQHQSSPMESMAPIVEESQNIVTPLITHVTSLNPRALQIVEGTCHICRVPTKKKCLGCYQVYYCSYNCQRFDWGQHINLCKSKAASQPSSN